MLSLFLLTTTLSMTSGQLTPNMLTPNSPQICLSGACNFFCASGNCRGLFYCGPKSISCTMSCPRSGCNDEIALISHSAGKTSINCFGESTCKKLIVVCGHVDVAYIQGLNNLAGNLQNIFEMLPAILTSQRGLTAPFGQCTLNCGLNACHDTHFLCQGPFANGKGCEVNANSRPSFENGNFVCGLSNYGSHCQANCGMTTLRQLPLLNMGNIGNEPACSNAAYNCYRGNCFCDGIGCSQNNLERIGVIRSGKAPKFTGISKPQVELPRSQPKTASIFGPPPSNTNTNQRPPNQPQRRIVVFPITIDAPFKGEQALGAYTHLRCGITNCKILCEHAGACQGLTVLAGPTVEQLTVECSSYGCNGFKVESNALKNEFKCKDAGACGNAYFKCGNDIAGRGPAVTMCKTECQNGGCSSGNGYPGSIGTVTKLKGTKMECGKNVLRCELHADSANGLYNPLPVGGLFGGGVFGGNTGGNNQGVMGAIAPGSFEGGEMVCNVASAMVGSGIGAGVFGNNVGFRAGLSGVLPGGAPTCVLKCSTHKTKRYCGGVINRCKVNSFQCQCEDYCINHPQECFVERIRGDCPRLTMPTRAPTNKPTMATTTTTMTTTTTASTVTTAAVESTVGETTAAGVTNVVSTTQAAATTV